MSKKLIPKGQSGLAVDESEEWGKHPLWDKIRLRNLGYNVPEETYSGGMLPDVNITASAPSIQTKEGTNLAKKMAADVYTGKMQMKDVPRDYQNYVEGEVKGAIPYAQREHPGARAVGLGATGVMGGLALKAAAPVLEYMFTPSSWAIKGKKVFDPFVGKLLDKTVQLDFVKEGTEGLINKKREGTLREHPIETTLDASIVALPAAKVAGKLGIAGYKGVQKINGYRQLGKEINKGPRYIQYFRPDSHRIELKPNSNWTESLPGANDYSYTRVEPYSEYTKTAESPLHKKFVDDVNQTITWAKDRGKILEPKTDELFIDFDALPQIGSGAESYVYSDPNNSNQVLKILNHGFQFKAGLGKDKEQVIKEAINYANYRNKRLYNVPINLAGIIKKDGFYRPVFSQKRLNEINDPKSIEDKLNTLIESIGDERGLVFRHTTGGTWTPELKRYKDINNSIYENDLIELNTDPMLHPDRYRGVLGKDISPRNIGLLNNGHIMGFDLYKKGGKLNKKRNG